MMKKSITYIALLSCIAMMSGCVNIEEFDEPALKISKTFYAETEEPPTTKTILGGKDENRTRYVLWMPEDRIGVVPASGGSFDIFVTKNTEASNRATFEGETVLALNYFAIYPYDENATITDGTVLFTLKREQSYKENSFNQDAFPMIARSSETNSEGLKFSNLCGLLEINLTGEEKVTKITFSSDKKVSGTFKVATDYDEYPEMIAEASGSTSTTLNCGEGVQLKTDSPTPFYFVLPPGTYEKFTIMIQTSDGKIMFKQAKNPLNIKRSHTAYAGALEYAESASIDLSLHGTANSYVISDAGMYCFDASVIGNGSYGIISDASFHTEDPNITPASVEVLWETDGANIKAEKGELLSNVTLKDGYVHFLSNGVEGNALVAVKGEKGSVLWSWHLWFTDSPIAHKYVNTSGSYIVMDRNLGATRADSGSGEEWKESYGAIYQWGRKDPFLKDIYELLRSNDGGKGPLSLAHSIQNPTKVGVMNGGAGGHPSWVDVKNDKLWSNSVKTIYDPCPVGYRVPDTYIWKGFTLDGNNTSILESINASGVKDHGFNFIYDGINSTWYPSSPMVDWNGGYHDPNKIGRLWTTTPERSFKYETSPAITFDDTECWENYAIPVRCVKDEGHVDLALPVVEMIGAKDATVESVTLTFNIVNPGASEVIESGIIYSITPDLSTGNGQKVVAAGNEYKVDLTGLSEGTRYYAIAYATNSFGTSYSKEITFYTEFANSTNLSKYGTSNCYIVSEYGAYTFDASVRGNSTESVGIPAFAEVLWETKNTTKASSGEIIRSGSVELTGDFVNFVANGVEGNALIAVKDALGTILWSWHIWVTDQPQEQHYINSLGDFHVLDRNLGATRADRGTGDEWNESSGFLFQWGRKDPFADGHYEWGSSKFTIEESIRKPTIYAAKNSPWTSEWNDNLWSSQKTVYDPCPVGYKIVSKDIWAGFTATGESVTSREEINALGEFDHGWYFYIDGSSTAWYPASPHIGYNGPFEYHSDGGSVWCNTPFNIYTFGASNAQFATAKQFEAVPARCMREYPINVNLSTTEITNITKNSATVGGSMKYIGPAVVTEMGFVYSSTTESPNINSTKVTVSVAEGTFSKTLTDLNPSTTYYVRTFASEGNVVIYGNVLSFTTTINGDTEELPNDDYEWE